MSILGEKVKKIRSKNAGPFWITVDIFCGSQEVYKDVCLNLNNLKIANLLLRGNSPWKGALGLTN